MEGVEMPELELPGFRFHPTEQELLGFYLKNMVTGKRECFDVIGFLNIYHHDPWELPGLARNGEREWYFFVPRDKKLGRDGRPNRTTEKGFWKATGSDQRIFETVDRGRLIIGLRKTLVFYEGRAPQGKKTDWIMSEYRLPDDSPLPKEMVLCKIYRKATSLKVLDQRAAVEEGSRLNRPPPLGTSALRSHQYYSSDFEKEPEEKKRKLAVDGETAEGFRLQGSSSSSSSFSSSSSCSLGSGQVPFVGEALTELEAPWFTVDWTQDSFWSRNSSPWLQTNAINFKS